MASVTYMAWPENVRMSYHISRIIGLCEFGAADFTEIYQAVLRIDPTDDASWNREWLRMANLVEEMAEEAEAYSNWSSARFAYQRASNYYRLAQDVLDPDDPNKLPQLWKAREHFLKCLPYQEAKAEVVDIPYETTNLTGFFVHARWGEGPAPTLIWLCGADSLSEENYFNMGIQAADNGYNALFYDHPGPGLALYQQGLGTRYDTEAYVTPAVDYLLTRTEVDASRIAMGGPSFAAYHVSRAAAFEQRLAAAVSAGATYEWGGTQALTGGHAKRMHKLFGAANDAEFEEIRSRFKLGDVLGKITCPFLAIVGVDDFVQFPASTAIKVIKGVGSAVKKAIVIERDNELGGVLHCQKDNLHLVQAEIFNWLNDVLGHALPRPHLMMAEAVAV
ncbi:MAG: prolyl oligopeptidase family serine peptidase [Chloroflexi bacterium]|nr:prolyl oligopeptidase family serine peptidase [Chloroflexota bacterium]